MEISLKWRLQIWLNYKHRLEQSNALQHRKYKRMPYREQWTGASHIILLLRQYTNRGFLQGFSLPNTCSQLRVWFRSLRIEICCHTQKYKDWHDINSLHGKSLQVFEELLKLSGLTPCVIRSSGEKQIRDQFTSKYKIVICVLLTTRFATSGWRSQNRHWLEPTRKNTESRQTIAQLASSTKQRS